MSASLKSSASLDVIGTASKDAHDLDVNRTRELSRFRNVWTKMDLVVLPVVTMMYFLSSLDRSNIGNARVAGLQEQLKLTNDQYSIALTVTLIPYILIEIPSNLLLKIVGPRILLPSMVVLWGIICTLQGIVHNYSGLLVCRFFLGLVEGGLLPGLSLYLSSFYPRRKLQLRVSIFFSATSLASAFSGLLAAAIVNMDGVGRRPGWAWLFILEGIFTTLFGLTTFFLLPNSATTVPFFTNEEKEYIRMSLHNDGIVAIDESDDQYTWAECRHTFVQPHVILLALVGFFNGSTLSGLSYFLPSIVVSLGFEGSRAQLMSVPPFAASALLSLVSSVLSDYYGRRGVTILFFAIVGTAGFALFLGSFVDAVRYGSLFLVVPGTFCIGPPLGTWTANNSTPHIRRATALALITTMTNTGAILSTWLLGALSAPPRYTTATITLLVFQAVIIVCVLLNCGWLTRESRRKAKRRVEVGAKNQGGSLQILEGGDEGLWYDYAM